ncbi:MAG: hypothetical protein K9N46_05575 [Candidatus Marinimicrobia bacterium]|nr:hypothetical protein [Candidatus Neomarinimicrobiota bacterium]MCF7880193.1 hypothetical protein [Candidatus Neomarinimicrobiota bacterium]
MCTKVIFDRSAFASNSIEELHDDRLLSLLKDERIIVHHSPIFLEETLQMYYNNNLLPQLKKELPFILRICNGKYFRHKFEVWKNELGEKDLSYEDKYFLSDEDEDLFKENVSSLIMTEKLGGKELNQIRRKSMESEKSAIEHRELYKWLRDEYTSEFTDNIHTPDEREKLIDWYVKEHIDSFAEKFIKKRLPNLPDIAYVNWKKDKDKYPYFTNYAKGIMYSAVYAFGEPNQRLDKNALADVGILMYLTDADIIVSNDTRFMSFAFDYLYGNSGKNYLSTKDFIESLKFI